MLGCQPLRLRTDHRLTILADHYSAKAGQAEGLASRSAVCEGLFCRQSRRATPKHSHLFYNQPNASAMALSKGLARVTPTGLPVVRTRS